MRMVSESRKQDADILKVILIYSWQFPMQYVRRMTTAREFRISVVSAFCCPPSGNVAALPLVALEFQRDVIRSFQEYIMPGKKTPRLQHASVHSKMAALLHMNSTLKFEVWL